MWFVQVNPQKIFLWVLDVSSSQLFDLRLFLWSETLQSLVSTGSVTKHFIALQQFLGIFSA